MVHVLFVGMCMCGVTFPLAILPRHAGRVSLGRGIPRAYRPTDDRVIRPRHRGGGVGHTVSRKLVGCRLDLERWAGDKANLQ